jgi:cytidylate kinase
MKLKIAIDGPAGAGKSTVARLVARKLGYKYIDTGAMYRAVTLAVLRSKIPISDEKAISQLVEKVQLEIRLSADGQNHIYLDGKEVSSEIRQQSVSEKVSDVANQANVRKFLVEKQRQMSSSGNIVLDGRDIGTVVLPEAELKIYLVASLEVRAQRRYLELNETNEKISLDDLTAAIEKRDSKDANNKYGPMRPAQDAITIDTDNLSADQVVSKIVDLANTITNRTHSYQ